LLFEAIIDPFSNGSPVMQAPISIFFLAKKGKIKFVNFAASVCA
jgi:hypothetical protein